MGIIKKIILSEKIENNTINNDRFCIELCENVHLHYKDIRIEFNPIEFLDILNCIKKIPEEDVKKFEYGDNSFKEVARLKLKSKSEFENRYQIEQQDSGLYHTHYRNLRIESKKNIKIL